MKDELTMLAVSHRTTYHYSTFVETAQHLATIRPLVSPWQAAKLQRILIDDFSAQFALSLALKDVHLALEAAGGDRFTALGCLAEEWQLGVDQGLGDQDLTVVTRALEGQGGTR